MNNQQTLNEIKFALENGHTNVTMGTEKDGTFYIMGAFGYIAIDDQTLVNEIKELVAQYTETKETAETFQATLEKLFGEKYVIKSKKIKDALNNKLIECTCKRPNGSKVYYFQVEGLDTAYGISATMLANGSYWVKEGRFRS